MVLEKFSKVRPVLRISNKKKISKENYMEKLMYVKKILNDKKLSFLPLHLLSHARFDRSNSLILFTNSLLGIYKFLENYKAVKLCLKVLFSFC